MERNLKEEKEVPQKNMKLHRKKWIETIISHSLATLMKQPKSPIVICGLIHLTS